jgi:uncharacterized membrane protein
VVRTGDYIRQGWELFRETPAELVKFTALFLLIMGLSIFVPLAPLALFPPLATGFYAYLFKKSDGPVVFRDFFGGFQVFGPAVLAGVSIGVLIAAGLVLFIAPGVYLAVAYKFAFLLIADKKMDFWQAMETSRRIITRRWLPWFGFLLALALLNLLGLLFFGAGLLVTLPWSICAVAVAYDDVVGLGPHGKKMLVKSADVPVK